MTVHRFALLALSLCLGLAVVPASGAATWQGPTALSDPGVDTEGPADIAIGAGSDAAATWYDATGGGRTMLARKPAGGTWSAPISIGASSFNSKVVGVDGAGNVTAAGTTGPGTNAPGTITVTTWAAGAATPTAVSLPGTDVLLRRMAVSASGNVVIGATGHTSGGTFDVVLYYRAGPTGTFSMQRYAPGAANISYQDPSVAVNDAGDAVAAFTTYAGFNAGQALATVRTAAGPWGALQQMGSDNTITSYTAPVGIDSGGNALAAYSNAARATFVARHRRDEGSWLQSAGNLTAGTPGQAGLVGMNVNAGGTAMLSWIAAQAGSASTLNARIGSTVDPDAFGPVEPITSGTFESNPATTLGDDGRAVAVWQVAGSLGNLAQARVREPGAVWGDIHDLSGPVASYRAPEVATDGHGHVATVSSSLEGTLKRTMTSSLDLVAPTVSPTIAVTGSALAGDAVTLGVTASDVWSPLSASWTFGDGTTATGLTAAHAYSAAGTYTATVTVTDGGGNAVARQVAVSIAVKQSTLSTASFTAKWKQSRVSGTLVVRGTVPRAGTYEITATSGNTVKLRTSLKLPVGAFGATLPLIAGLLPGTYHVSLAPPFAADQVRPADRDAVLTAPVEGVVDLVTMSGAKSGPAARTLRNARTIWASFRFATVPKGTLKLTWYRTVKGKKSPLGATSKSPSKKVASYLRLGGVLRGTFTAVLSRKGVVIAQGAVKAQ